MLNLRKSNPRGIERDRSLLNQLLNLIIILTIIVVVSAIFTLFLPARDASPQAWERLINEYLRRYPAAESADIYKLVYQGTVGSAHLGSDTTMIRHFLEQELASIEPDSGDLLERICPSDIYMRINLRRYKLEGGDPGQLVKIVANSGDTTLAAQKRFIKRWQLIRELVKKGKIPLNPNAFEKFDAEIVALKYPVIHHSPQYLEKYQPAYRVVRKRIWDKYNPLEKK